MPKSIFSKRTILGITQLMGTLHPEVSVPMVLLTRFNLPKGHSRRFRLMPLLL